MNFLRTLLKKNVALRVWKVMKRSWIAYTVAVYLKHKGMSRNFYK
jgi:hypothetical protein